MLLQASEENHLSPVNNKSSLRKPTEYSASVGQTQREEQQPSESGELEIKSPVHFEMVAESDVKVNDTNSS